MDRGHRLFGIETEYGLLVEGKGASDLIEESRALVRAYAGAHAGPWDYRTEDPRRDLRGYRVDHLQYNPQDALYDKPGTTSLSNEELRSDRVLVNGARLYNDHGHPEYSTPECHTLRDLVAHDKAGERIVLACARARSAARGGRAVTIFKNNTDLHGMSYGTHEGYLTSREIPFDQLFLGLLPFFVTRQVFAGAGKVGIEASDGPFAKETLYQLSQRADFFTEEASVDTLHRRPILNTRDEPHADPRRYRRLHVICGDANLSEFATGLKVGTTQLALALIETGWQPRFRLARPVDAIKHISRDPSLRWMMPLEDGRTISALDLQRLYLADAEKLLAGQDEDTDWTLREWRRVLDDLEADPFRAEDRVDWVAKRKLLETYIEAEGLWWESDVIRSLDLEYHNVDPELGLYYALEQSGQMLCLASDADVERAMTQPPTDTRAFVRGECVRRYASAIERIGWGRIGFRSAGGTRWLDLHPLVDGNVAELNRRLAAEPDLAAVLNMFSGGTNDEPV